MDHELQELKKEKNKLDNRALFLYFIQNGKCMYSGDSLDLNQLHLYEVDHIIPQSYIKDDSIDNLVLVKKSENQYKSDRMLIKQTIIEKQRNMWLHLYKSNLISKKKYDNLTRGNFDEKELKGFIARQLVETRQITKHVTQLLQTSYPSTKVVAIKAELTSNLRNQYGFYKNRNFNDFHHAHDAYLASMLGRYITLRFPLFEREFNYGEYMRFATNRENAEKCKYGFVVGSMRNNFVDSSTGELLWQTDEELGKIRKTLNYKDCFISRKKEELTGEFYKQTIYSKELGKIPIKAGLDPQKYGGYTGENKAYYAVIEYDGKKNRERKLVGIPIRIAKLAERDSEEIRKYCVKDLNYQSVKILKNKILKYQLVSYKGSLLYLTSGVEAWNAKQLFQDEKCCRTAYYVNKTQLDNVTDDDLNEFYLTFLEKLQQQFTIFVSIAEKLRQSYVAYSQLSKADKARFIGEMLKITSAKASNANFKSFGINGLNDRLGRLEKINFKISEMEFIDRSVTGMFERRYKI
ncbi:MAG: type II CRISPR RNA-guided endonuclease Cas9 [Desulfitobacteriaceae bacterium]